MDYFAALVELQHRRQRLPLEGQLAIGVVLELGKQIPEAEFVVPGGGYFLWLDLAEGTDTRQILAPAKERGVAFVAGPDFMLEGGERSLRLSFASVPPGEVPEGIARIDAALESVRG